MMTFDGWDARFCGDAMALPGDYLMHFRTRGSKNGVRRYQQEDGTWTPLGLKLRKEREGWGETRNERRAEKKVARAEKKAARASRKMEKREAARDRIMSKRKASLNELDRLSDEELQKKINRVKMEQEYKELTKSPILKAGEKAISSYMEARAKKAEREDAKAKRELDLKRVEADIIKAREGTKKAKMESKKSKEERKIWQSSAKRDEQKTALKRAKIDWKATTLHGGIIRRINAKMTSGVSELYKSKRTKIGEVEGKKILAKYNNQLKRRSDNEAAKAQRKADRQVKVNQKKAREQNIKDWLIKGDAAKIGNEARKRQRQFNNWK